MDKIIRIFLSLAILLSISISFYTYTEDNDLHLYFLDVGQGDAVLIQTSDHKFALIDGGPNGKVLSELGEVLPFWVRRLDLVILTHPDSDHLAGLVDVLETFEVGEVATTGVRKDTAIYKEFDRLVSSRGIKESIIDSSSDFVFGCCISLDFLWPAKGADLDEIEPVNNSSIAINLIYKGYKMFLAGDIETATEEELVKIYDLEADFFKVSHHGSLTSSTVEFLEDLDPEIAFISVGKDNKFGHPKEEVLERLVENGIKIYRTDSMGRIELEIDESGYKIKCEVACKV